MKKQGSTLLAAALMAVALLIPHESKADVGIGLTLEKLGILSTPGTGGRPSAMGLAYTAVSDDAFALLYNPAGLAMVEGRELSIGLHHTGRDMTTSFEQLESTQAGSYTSFGNVAFAYPYPMRRSSLVFGFGVFRVGSSDLDIYRSGYIGGIPATAENSYSQSGNIYQYHFGVGGKITPAISLGAGFVFWRESIDFTEQIIYEDPGSLAVYTDDVALTMNGFSINIGMLVELNEIVKAGFMFTSPTWLTYRGDGYITYDGEYYEGPYVDWTYDEFGLIDEDYTMPMKFRGGLSAQFAPLLLSFDLEYIDYTQAKYNGRRLIDDLSPGRSPVFESAWNIYAGGEFAMPNLPVWIRAGYRYYPLVMPTMEEITIIEEDALLTYVGDAAIVRERQYYTFGAGFMIDRTLEIDAAVSIGSYERETEFSTEKQDVTEFILTGTYLF